MITIRSAISSGLAFLALLPGVALAEVSGVARIQSDFRRGKIDLETALLYKAYSLFDPEKLLSQYREEGIQKCGTSVIMEIRSNWNRLSTPVQRELSAYLQQKRLQRSYDSPSGRFRIHYDETGVDAVSSVDSDEDGAPDYVETVASIFDSVRALEVDRLGYRPPPDDGDGKYDVYLVQLGPNKRFGYTYPQTSVPPHRSSSYIEIDNDFEDAVYRDAGTYGLDAVRVTAAHEFFHAIQFSYYCAPDHWWMEASATWMEDVAYDDVNEYYRYLSTEAGTGFFDNPGCSLDFTNNCYEYGASVFLHYLSEEYGDKAIRTIWETMASKEGNGLLAIDQVVPGGIGKRIAEFAIWNYFTGFRAVEIKFYKEGERYPEMNVEAVHSDYPVGTERGVMGHLASEYIRFIPQDRAGGLRIFFDVDINLEWLPQVIAHKHSEVTIMRCAEIAEVRGWEQYDEIVFIPTVTAQSGLHFEYRYRAVFDPSLKSIEGLITQYPLLRQNYPNPFNVSTTIWFNLSKKDRVVLSIYTIAGELIRTLVDRVETEGLHSVTWDGKNDRGRDVGTGVYFCRMATGNRADMKKIAVVR